MTNAEFVSRVINDLNSLSKDSRMSKRYILHIGRQKSEFYISQKLNDRSLHKEDNLYQTISCFELENIELIKCDIIEFRRCKSLMKSKQKIPKLVYSRYGNSLKEVTTVDSEVEFRHTTPSQYRRDKNRKEKSKDVMYYVKDDYLYLIDSEIQVVDLYLLTVETEKIESTSSCSKEVNCKSLWDYKFVVPDKIKEVVIGETLKEVSTKKQVPTDENPNLNSNEK